MWEIGGAAKDGEVVKVGLVAGECLKRGSGSARSAEGAIEDMDRRGHRKFPVSNSELSMGEHAKGPLGKGAPCALYQSILMLAVRSGELQSQ